MGHDEYWSAQQRANVEAARDAGVNLAFFSGNEIFWKTRWENSIDGSGTAHRTLVSYKETHANAKIDPEPNVWTGTWRDPRFSPPADGGRPENALSGTLFMVDAGDRPRSQVPAADGKLRLWRNTTVASLAPGETATLGARHAGLRVGRRRRQRLPSAGPVRISPRPRRKFPRSSSTTAPPTGPGRRPTTSRSIAHPAARWSSAPERSSGRGASTASTIDGTTTPDPTDAAGDGEPAGRHGRPAREPAGRPRPRHPDDRHHAADHDDHEPAQW